MIKWSEEQLSVLSGKGNVLVSASAGSGKTTVMVEKVIRLLKGGADIRRILLMTFTRSASKEMREKLVKRMYEEIHVENGDLIRAQLENLPFASIETIDGFCFSLMKKYFNVAGCDPSASIGEDSAMKLARGECVDRVMERFFESQDEEFLKTVGFFRQRRSYAPFKETVLKIIDYASSRPNREGVYEKCATVTNSAIVDFYAKFRKKECEMLLRQTTDFLSDCDGENYQMHDGYKEIAGRLKEMLAVKDLKDFFAIASGIAVPTKIRITLVHSGRVSQELYDRCGALNDSVKGFASKVAKDGEAYAKRADGQQALIKRTLAKTCVAVEKEYENYKRRKNVVDMRDASDYALKILSDEKTKQEIKAKYDCVFVDEYQDTNYLQETLIEGIGRDNIFSVGDVKQAIYHFRSAEPEIFLKRGEKYDKENVGHNRYLNTNYRSCDEILDFTNRVCDNVMIKDFCGIDYKNTSRLRFGGQTKGIIGEKAVQIYLNQDQNKPKDEPTGVYSVKNASVDDGTDIESVMIAEKILSMVGNAEIEEKGNRRKVRFGDIAVLGRRNSDLNGIMETLRKNDVPFYLVRESVSVFPKREALVDVVRIILNADDDIPLYHALTSPVGGFSDEEIACIRSSQGEKIQNTSLWASINAYKGNANIEFKVKTFVDFIESMRKKSVFMTAEEVLTEILAHNFDVALLKDNADEMALLNAFVSYVGGIGANASCDEFIEFYDNCYQGNRPPSKDNAVVLMTMHSSKGLEFPVVFLPRQNRRSGNFVAHTEMDGELGLAVRLYAEEEKTMEDSFDARVIRMKRQEEERQESARLMYVAFTRAKNCLIISGDDGKTPASVFDTTSVIQWIKYAGEKDEGVRKLIEHTTVKGIERAEEIRVENKTFCGNKLKRVYAYQDRTATPMKYSVSEILEKVDGYGVNPFVGKGKGAKLGTVAHTLMQYVDYCVDTVEGVAKTLDDLIEQGYFTREETKGINLEQILRALNSDVVKRAKKYKYFREQPFVLYKDVDGEKVLVQGVIDLLIEEPDGVVVVDFKTGDVEKMKERYEKQLALYAESAEKILKKPVKRKVIYALGSGKEIDV